MPPTGDLARSPGMCPDWELNRQSLGSQASAKPTEPHQPGLGKSFDFTKLLSSLFVTMR